MSFNPVMSGDAEPYQAEFDAILRNYNIIDIGTILRVSKDGTMATVQGFGVHGAIVQSYEAEILYPGNMTLGAVGNPCLLIRTATGIANVRKGLITQGDAMHPAQGVKVIPLFLGNMSVRLGYRDGALIVTTDEYTCSAGSSSIDISFNKFIQACISNMGMSLTSIAQGIDVDSSGNIDFICKDLEGNFITRIVYDAESGALSEYAGAMDVPSDDELDDMDTFTKWKWIKTLLPDGHFTINQQDEDENILVGLDIDPEGTISVTTGENISATVDQDGNISISNSKCTIVVDADGNIQIENEGDTSITTSGDTTIETSGDTSITTSGNTEITADGNIDVKATGSGKLTVGNSVDTVGGLFGALVDEVSGLATVGSPAAHTVNPANIAKLNALKAKAGQVLG